jgi:hypothetical protein
VRPEVTIAGSLGELAQQVLAAMLVT